MKSIIPLILLLLIIGCTEPAPKPAEQQTSVQQPDEIIMDDSNEVVDEVVVLEDPIKEKLNGDQLFEATEDSMYLIEVNCTYDVRVKEYDINYETHYDRRVINITQGEKYFVLNESSINMGSGFLADDKILSNYHVIECDAETLKAVYDELFVMIDTIYQQGIPLNRSFLGPFVTDELYENNIDIFQAKNKEAYEYRDTREFYENWFTAALAEYIQENFEIRFKGRHVYAYHPTDFEKKIPVELEKWGASMPGKDYIMATIETDKPDLAINAQNITVGDKIYAVGFPYSSMKDVLTIEDMFENMKEPPVISAGIVSSKKESDLRIDYYMLDASSYQGASGGPVLNEYGEVIGIMTAGHTEASFTYLLPLYEVYE